MKDSTVSNATQNATQEFRDSPRCSYSTADFEALLKTPGSPEYSSFVPPPELPVDKSPLVLRPVTKRINRPKSSLLGRRSLRSTGYEVVQTYRGLSPKKGPHSSPVPVEMVRQQLPFAAGTWSTAKGMSLFKQWVKQAQVEEGLYGSVALWIEQVQTQMHMSTAELPLPNSLQTVMSSYLLIKLCSVFGHRYWSVLKHLLSDIFSAVFMDWATVKDVFLGAATPEDVAQAGVFSERELFFEAHAGMSGQHEEHCRKLAEEHSSQIASNRAIVMRQDNEIVGWQVMALRSCFKAWRQLSSRTKARNTGIEEVADRYTVLAEANLIKYAWVQWRLCVAWSQQAKLRKDMDHQSFRARSSKAQVELYSGQLKSKIIEMRRDFETTTIAIHDSYRKEIQECNAFVEELEADIQQLMDDNSRVLQQLEHYKDLAHTWASLSHEMFSTVKGTIDMVHPMDFLSSSGQKDDRDSAELLMLKYGAEEILLRWFNAYLKKSANADGDARQIENFGSDLQDGEMYLALIKQLFPRLISLPPEFEDVNAYIRAHSVLESMDLVGIPRVMGVSDMMAGNSLKNLVFVSFLFNHFSVMNWIGNGKGRDALLEPFEVDEEELASPRGSLTIRKAEHLVKELQEKQRALEEEREVAKARENANSMKNDESWVNEQQKIRGLARKLRDSRRTKDKQKLEAELARHPLPSNWQPDTFATGFRVMVNTCRAWTYLGYHCQSDLLTRFIKMRASDDETIEIFDNRKAKEKALFTDIPVERIKDIDEDFVDTLAEELQAAKQVIHEGFDELKSIYQYYASTDAGFHLSMMGFMAFCKDIAVDKLLKAGQLERIFFTCIKQADGADVEEAAVLQSTMLKKGKKGKKERYKDKHMMPPKGFMEALIRLSNLRYGGHLAAAFCTLLDEHVIPNAHRCSVGEFKAIVRQADIQKILKKHQKFLNRAFKYYSASTTATKSYLTFKDWEKLLNDCKLFDNLFTLSEAHMIFSMVQDESFTSEDIEEADREMDFDEWIDGLVCTAVFKSPAMYIPVYQRLDRFLLKVVIPHVNKLSHGLSAPR